MAVSWKNVTEYTPLLVKILIDEKIENGTLSVDTVNYTQLQKETLAMAKMKFPSFKFTTDKKQEFKELVKKETKFYFAKRQIVDLTQIIKLVEQKQNAGSEPAEIEQALKADRRKHILFNQKAPCHLDVEHVLNRKWEIAKKLESWGLPINSTPKQLEEALSKLTDAGRAEVLKFFEKQRQTPIPTVQPLQTAFTHLGHEEAQKAAAMQNVTAAYDQMTLGIPGDSVLRAYLEKRRICSAKEVAQDVQFKKEYIQASSGEAAIYLSQLEEDYLRIRNDVFARIVSNHPHSQQLYQEPLGSYFSECSDLLDPEHLTFNALWGNLERVSTYSSEVTRNLDAYLAAPQTDREKLKKDVPPHVLATFALVREESRQANPRLEPLSPFAQYARAREQGVSAVEAGISRLGLDSEELKPSTGQKNTLSQAYVKLQKAEAEYQKFKSDYLYQEYRGTSGEVDKDWNERFLLSPEQITDAKAKCRARKDGEIISFYFAKRASGEPESYTINQLQTDLKNEKGIVEKAETLAELVALFPVIRYLEGREVSNAKLSDQVRADREKLVEDLDKKFPTLAANSRFVLVRNLKDKGKMEAEFAKLRHLQKLAAIAGQAEQKVLVPLALQRKDTEIKNQVGYFGAKEKADLPQRLRESAVEGVPMASWIGYETLAENRFKKIHEFIEKGYLTKEGCVVIPADEAEYVTEASIKEQLGDAYVFLEHARADWPKFASPEDISCFRAFLKRDKGIVRPEDFIEAQLVAGRDAGITQNALEGQFPELKSSSSALETAKKMYARGSLSTPNQVEELKEKQKAELQAIADRVKPDLTKTNPNNPDSDPFLKEDLVRLESAFALWPLLGFSPQQVVALLAKCPKYKGLEVEYLKLGVTGSAILAAQLAALQTKFPGVNATLLGQIDQAKTLDTGETNQLIQANIGKISPHGGYTGTKEEGDKLFQKLAKYPEFIRDLTKCNPNLTADQQMKLAAFYIARALQEAPTAENTLIFRAVFAILLPAAKLTLLGQAAFNARNFANFGSFAADKQPFAEISAQNELFRAVVAHSNWLAEVGTIETEIKNAANLPDRALAAFQDESRFLSQEEEQFLVGGTPIPVDVAKRRTVEQLTNEVLKQTAKESAVAFVSQRKEAEKWKLFAVPQMVEAQDSVKGTPLEESVEFADLGELTQGYGELSKHVLTALNKKSEALGISTERPTVSASLGNIELITKRGPSRQEKMVELALNPELGAEFYRQLPEATATPNAAKEFSEELSRLTEAGNLYKKMYPPASWVGEQVTSRMPQTVAFVSSWAGWLQGQVAAPHLSKSVEENALNIWVEKKKENTGGGISSEGLLQQSYLEALTGMDRTETAKFISLLRSAQNAGKNFDSFDEELQANFIRMLQGQKVDTLITFCESQRLNPDFAVIEHHLKAAKALYPNRIRLTSLETTESGKQLINLLHPGI